VFAGGWSLEAAEALGADALRLEESVFELLSQLVAKSMVLVEKPRETTPNIVRYRFLETIRQYAEEKLVEAGEADVAPSGLVPEPCRASRGGDGGSRSKAVVGSTGH
jgi:predicted ATPase